ncbi:MAG TPA: hypothetical protein PKL10_02405 [Nitrospira sp.]|nr:hypothetical protein [Nitrospira sp.]
MTTTDKWKGGGRIRQTLAEAEADLEEAIAYVRYPCDDPTPIVTRDDMRIVTRLVSDWTPVT